MLTADYERICAEAELIAKGQRNTLNIGYLRSCSGQELRRALEIFTEKYPDAEVMVKYGNHEELYELLRTEQADIVINDQRRAFSDEYVNMVLASRGSCIEISLRSPLAVLKKVTPQELKNIPCILVASPFQQENEREYYCSVIGIQSGFLYAENLEEARLMLIGRKGFLLSEGGGDSPTEEFVTRVPLLRGNDPIIRNYCAFWKKDNSGYYVEEFADILKKCFEK